MSYGHANALVAHTLGKTRDSSSGYPRPLRKIGEGIGWRPGREFSRSPTLTVFPFPSYAQGTREDALATGLGCARGRASRPRKSVGGLPIATRGFMGRTQAMRNGPEPLLVIFRSRHALGHLGRAGGPVQILFVQLAPAGVCARGTMAILTNAVCVGRADADSGDGHCSDTRRYFSERTMLHDPSPPNAFSSHTRARSSPLRPSARRLSNGTGAGKAAHGIENPRPSRRLLRSLLRVRISPHSTRKALILRSSRSERLEGRGRPHGARDR